MDSTKLQPEGFKDNDKIADLMLNHRFAEADKLIKENNFDNAVLSPSLMIEEEEKVPSKIKTKGRKKKDKMVKRDSVQFDSFLFTGGLQTKSKPLHAIGKREIQMGEIDMTFEQRHDDRI